MPEKDETSCSPTAAVTDAIPASAQLDTDGDAARGDGVGDIGEVDSSETCQRCRKLEKENRRLKKQLHDAKKSATITLPNVGEQFEGMMRGFSGMLSVTGVASQLSAVQAENTKLQTRMGALEAEKTTLQTRTGALEAENTRLQTRVQELETANAALRAQFDQLVNAHAADRATNAHEEDRATLTALHREQTRRECLAQGAELLQVCLHRMAGNAADKRRFLAAARSIVEDWNLGIYDTPVAAAAALVVVMDDCLPDRDPALTGDVMLAMLELKEARNAASHPVRANDRNQHAPLVAVCDAHAAVFTALLPHFAPAVASMVQVVRSLLETH